jgi:hypothetical protein
LVGLNNIRDKELLAGLHFPQRLILFDTKISKAFTSTFQDVNIVDAGRAGAVAAPFFEESEVVFLAFCFNVYASVRFVAYKTFQGKLEGFLLSGGAEKDALYFAGDAEGNVFGHAVKDKKSKPQRTQTCLPARQGNAHRGSWRFLG